MLEILQAAFDKQHRRSGKPLYSLPKVQFWGNFYKKPIVSTRPSKSGYEKRAGRLANHSVVLFFSKNQVQ